MPKDLVMSRLSQITRMNSIIEGDSDVTRIDGPDCQEYEIDNTFLASISRIDKGCFNLRNNVYQMDSRLGNPEYLKQESEKNRSNVIGDCVSPPWQDTCIRSKTVCDEISNLDDERPRKLQCLSDREVPELSQNLEALEIQDSHITEILKRDDDGDNLIIIAIILKKTRLAVIFTNLIPCFKLLNIYNNMFQTALHVAASTNNVTIVRRLIVAGANVTLKDRHGNTALHIACNRGYLEVAKALLEPVRYPETKVNSYQIPFQKIPQNLELRNSQGLTCLLIAAYRCDLKLMDLLISKYADINAIDMKNGKTCLHIFAESGNFEMLKYVMSKDGLDIDQRTYSSFSAAELASYRGHSNIVSYLLYHGYETDIRPITSDEFDADLSDSEVIELDG